MAPLPPTPSGVIRITHDVAGIVFRWEIGYTGGPPSTANLNSIATAARTAYSNQLKALCSSGYSMILTQAYDLQTPATPIGQDATAVAGTRAGTAAPLNVTALLNFQVNRRYRGSKPKVWLPFGTDTDIASNIAWATTFTTAVDTAWAAYVAALSGTSYGTTSLTNQVCVSYYSGKTKNPNPSGRLQYVPTPRGTPLVQQVTGVSCRTVFGSQRRRL